MSGTSATLFYGFIALLGLTLAAAVAIVVRWARLRVGPVVAALAAWLTVTGALAQAGILARWDIRPPPLLLTLLSGGLVTLWLGTRPFAGRLANTAPLAVLIGFQSFRFPLELLLHRAYSDGVMPVQMSYSGLNLDIVSGLMALVLGAWATRIELPRAAVWGFELIGFGLLINIVSVAIASTPIFAAFGPDRLNTWVTHVPFIWLPAIFVTFALFGHVVLLRRLMATR